MVVKLTGKIDGQDIIFERREGDWWETTIPHSLNGIYIVELTATDDAGNTAYTCRYILTIDLTALCVHLEPYPYWVEPLAPEYYATMTRVECGGVI